MTQIILTHAMAVAEIERRRLPKGTRPKAANDLVFRMSGADLADAAELLAPKGRKAKATKAPAKPAKLTAEQNRARFAAQAAARKGTGVGGAEHTKRRDAAFAYRAAVRAEGGRISLDDACALFGTAKAGVMATMSAEQIAELEAGATLSA